MSESLRLKRQRNDFEAARLTAFFQGRFFIRFEGALEVQSRKGEERMTFFILTNNPQVIKLRENEMEVLFTEDTYMGVLRQARDLIHQGHRMLTHPLSGSVKPKENPYKSIMFTKEKGALDRESLGLIENAIITAEKFPDKSPYWTPKVRDDLALVDYTLITSALPSAGVQ